MAVLGGTQFGEIITSTGETFIHSGKDEDVSYQPQGEMLKVVDCSWDRAKT